MGKSRWVISIIFHLNDDRKFSMPVIVRANAVKHVRECIKFREVIINLPPFLTPAINKYYTALGCVQKINNGCYIIRVSNPYNEIIDELNYDID